MDQALLAIKIRGMRHVVRFQQNPSIKRNNVAEHSYYVAMYAMIVAKILGLKDADSHKVIAYCLLHDTHEGISTELPQNVKRQNKTAAMDFECTAIDELYTNSDLFGDFAGVKVDGTYELENGLYKLVFKIADLLDAFIYSVEEVQMGNKFYVAIIKELKTAIDSVAKDLCGKIHDSKKGIAFIDFIMGIYCRTGTQHIVGDPQDMNSMTHIHKGMEQIVG